ncbi:hypothetical protein [Caballeronia glathei]|jgi:hypothetical protein|nr:MULTISPECIES: hypothetical protein [Burkholderiaceae]
MAQRIRGIETATARDPRDLDVRASFSSAMRLMPHSLKNAR